MIVLIRQIETHVLTPLLLGRALSLHPLLTVVAILTGTVLVGITGALVAVPILAMVNTALLHMLARRDQRYRAGLEDAANAIPTQDVPT
jgi:predicted PurR-regulated permease PerM